MKILILTGKFGMGHYQAAQAIKEELENNPKDDIEIIDWIEYLTPGCAKYIYAGYSSLIGHNTFFTTIITGSPRIIRQTGPRITPSPAM